MKRIRNFTKSLVALTLAVLGLFVNIPYHVSASDDLTDAACDGIKAIGGECTSKDESSNEIASLIQRIVNALLFVVGALSVIMIIIGGIRFVVSRGDPQAAASARNTVMYALVGVVVALVAYGLVNWVLGQFIGSSSSSSTTLVPSEGLT